MTFQQIALLRKILWLPVLYGCCSLAACKSNGMGKGAAENLEDVYFDYRISGEEGNDSVAVVLKFREYDEYGEAVRINGTVMLDGKPLAPDSTPMTGPYYAVNKPLAYFTGKHNITVNADGRKYSEEFSFRPYAFKNDITDTVTRGKWMMEFEGLDKKDVLRIVMTDTSFTGMGIHRVDTVWNNRLVLTKGDLVRLESGPVNMELTKEWERPVKNGTMAGGILAVYFTIRREFYLVD